MRYRSCGPLTPQASVIGFGAWQLGNDADWGPMNREDAIQLVRQAVADGCTFFDTAPGYGRGLSEELLGAALEGYRERVLVNTKVGHSADGRSDFSPDAIRRSLDESLQRLRTTYIDSVILHNPPSDQLVGDSPAMRALARLQEEGVIRAYGASVDSADDMETVMRTSQSQVLEVLFNIFFQETGRAFGEAMRRGVGLVVKVPFDSGWLAGRYNAATRFPGVRSRWTPAVIARRASLVEDIRFIEADGVPMTQGALAFILAHRAVSTVIPGVRTLAQWQDSWAAADQDMPADTVDRLHRFWAARLEHDPLPW